MGCPGSDAPAGSLAFALMAQYEISPLEWMARSGGMSVALDAAQNLPKPRLPKSLGGEGRDPVFSMFTAKAPRTLLLRPDRYPHALVEPERRCALEEFESNLAGTRSLWSKAHD